MGAGGRSRGQHREVRHQGPPPPAGSPVLRSPPGGTSRSRSRRRGAAICSWGGRHLLGFGGSRVRGWVRLGAVALR